MAMASQEGGPPAKTQAEVRLQQLLEKQLSTTGRLELVDFEEATESMRCIGHASAGVASLAEFREHSQRQRQADEKAWALRDLLQSKGLSEPEIKDHLQKIGGVGVSPSDSSEKAGAKRKRYGPHPSFMQGEEAEQQQFLALGQAADNSTEQQQSKHKAHFAELVAMAPVGSKGGRKPFLGVDQSELHKGATPQELARLTEEEGPRTVTEVFASPAPPLLDMYTYLEQRQQEAVSSQTKSTALEEANEPGMLSPDDCTQNVKLQEANVVSNARFVVEISEDEIRANRLDEEEIRQLPGGKFANYTPGSPSNTLYLKNLRPDVTEADLLGIFSRFQRGSGEKLVLRLMHQGRMKGQAFVTLPDSEAAKAALELLNGYSLRGKPVIIEYARGSKSPSLPLVAKPGEKAPIRSRKRKSLGKEIIIP